MLCEAIIIILKWWDFFIPPDISRACHLCVWISMMLISGSNLEPIQKALHFLVELRHLAVLLMANLADVFDVARLSSWRHRNFIEITLTHSLIQSLNRTLDERSTSTLIHVWTAYLLLVSISAHVSKAWVGLVVNFWLGSAQLLSRIVGLFTLV